MEYCAAENYELLQDKLQVLTRARCSTMRLVILLKTALDYWPNQNVQRNQIEWLVINKARHLDLLAELNIALSSQGQPALQPIQPMPNNVINPLPDPRQSAHQQQQQEQTIPFHDDLHASGWTAPPPSPETLDTE